MSPRHRAGWLGLGWATYLGESQLIFVCKMCVFVVIVLRFLGLIVVCWSASPRECVAFPRKNDFLPKLVVDFLRENSFRKKIMEIVQDLSEISHNNNGKTLEIVE